MSAKRREAQKEHRSHESLALNGLGFEPPTEGRIRLAGGQHRTLPIPARKTASSVKGFVHTKINKLAIFSSAPQLGEPHYLPSSSSILWEEGQTGQGGGTGWRGWGRGPLGAFALEAKFSIAQANYMQAPETSVQPGSLWSLQVWKKRRASTRKPACDRALFRPDIEIKNLLPTWFSEPLKTALPGDSV